MSCVDPDGNDYKNLVTTRTVFSKHPFNSNEKSRLELLYITKKDFVVQSIYFSTKFVNKALCETLLNYFSKI